MDLRYRSSLPVLSPRYSSGPRQEGIEWLQLPVQDSDKNVLAQIFVEFLNVVTVSGRSHRAKYAEILRRHRPDKKQSLESGKSSKTSRRVPRELVDPFHSDEIAGRNVTEAMYGQIAHCFDQYAYGAYFSPYTSVVGPSGIGKSFAIQQIARKNMTYVVYANFAPPNSLGYPTRSTVANYLEAPMNENRMLTLFECYLAVNMVNVDLCSEFGISARAFFRVQVHEDFEEMQKKLAKHFGEYNATIQHKFAGLIEARQKSGDRPDEIDPEKKQFDYQEYVNSRLDSYKANVTPLFKRLRDQLPAENTPEGPADGTKKKAPLFRRIRDPRPTEDTPKGPADGGKKEPPFVLFCFDEARTFLRHGDDDFRFDVARRALRHRSTVRSGWDRKKLFAVFLDTNSSVSELSPPKALDSSLRHVDLDMLLPPIYQIDSMDMLASAATYNDDGAIGVAQLFSTGRPLWGAIMKKSQEGFRNCSTRGGRQRTHRRQRADQGGSSARPPCLQGELLRSPSRTG